MRDHMFNLTKSNKKCTCSEQPPGDGGAAAAGAAKGPGWGCREHEPPGVRGPGRRLGGCGCDGPSSVQAGYIGEKGAAALLRAGARARQTRAVRTGITRAQSWLPADLSAWLPPLLRNLQHHVAHMFMRS